MNMLNNMIILEQENEIWPIYKISSKMGIDPSYQSDQLWPPAAQSELHLHQAKQEGFNTRGICVSNTWKTCP